jgi:hypothetical protein
LLATKLPYREGVSLATVRVHGESLPGCSAVPLDDACCKSFFEVLFAPSMLG